MSERAASQSQPGSSTSGNDAGRFSADRSGLSQQHGFESVAQGPLPPPRATATGPQTSSGLQLPPLPQTANVTAGSFPPPRSTGFSSILNPQPDDEPTPSRRRKADQLESPPSSVKSLPPIGRDNQGILGNARSAYAQPSGASEHFVRPTVTPRSPGLHRNASSYQINAPTGTISAQQSPFPISPRTRPYTIEPAGNAVPVNAPRSDPNQRPQGFPAPTHPSQRSRRVSIGTSRRMRGPSSSASPGTTYSGFSQPTRTSPATQYASESNMPTLASPYPSRLDASTGPTTSNAPPESTSLERQRQLGIPISSAAGQNVYQMMTLETTSGTVQLPVDVQAASRVADEKRRRNAGASARFRQRRKEKERESSTTISKLEQQVKALGEDADFYKRERDYLAGVVLQVPGGDRHFPRPQSPRHRRSSSVFASVSGSQGYTSGPEQMGTQSPDQGRNVRRRLSTISLPPQSTGMQGPPAGQPMTPGYAPPQGFMGAPMAQQPPNYAPAPGPYPSPHTRMSLPGSTSMMPGQLRPAPPPPGPPPLMQAPPQTGPYNPYAFDRRPPPPLHSRSYDGRQ